MEYIHTLQDPAEGGCFLCAAHAEPDRDAENLVLWRARRSFVILNRYPYTGGHCLIAPNDHIGRLEEIPMETVLEMMTLVRDAKIALEQAIHPDGFNVGINLGHCAGAGLPDHLHIHVVPRWVGDTNFMPILGDVRLVPEFLSRTREKLLETSCEMGLPECKPLGRED